MARDYANKRVSRPQRKIPRVFLAIFAVFCLLGALAIYAVHHQQGMPNWLSSAKGLVGHKEKNTFAIASAPPEEIQFDFYTELPNMRVNLPVSAEAKPFSTIIRKPTEQALQPIDLTSKIDESIKSALKQQGTQKAAVQFIVQINEFNEQISASQLRLSLLLAGIETEVVKTAEGKFRVQKGPFTSEHQAKAVQRQINNKGFDATIVKT